MHDDDDHGQGPELSLEPTRLFVPGEASLSRAAQLYVRRRKRREAFRMRIAALHVRHYRTLESLDLSFVPFYSAICGRNDSGKTNVVTAIRRLLQRGFRYHPDYAYPILEKPDFIFRDDFTKWVTGEPARRKISVSLDVVVDAARDGGVYNFLVDYLGLELRPEELEVSLRFEQSGQGDKEITVTTGNQAFTGLKAEEVLKRLQTSPTLLFHSSSDQDQRYPPGFSGALHDLSEQHTRRLEASQQNVNKVLSRITREQAERLTNLLGRLKDKYNVSLACPPFTLLQFPYQVALGDKKVAVDLEDWGSGTRNRTQILLTMFRAKQVADSQISASKVTPIVVVEEPESFLHPLAQAEFGRVLQDLAEEFKVQVIVTTHSPYLLSQARPESNILLERRVVRRRLRQTHRVDTAGERWMEPFALSLGLSDDSFVPWRELFFTQPEAVLLVEGDADREYFELCRNSDHGRDRLDFSGMIFPYGGRDTLKNQALIRFIKDRFDRVFITFDLDSKGIVEKSLAALGLKERVHYAPVGLNEAGKRNIEGLLPESIRTRVRAEHPDLVDALSGTTEERNEAVRKLKTLYLEAFTATARCGSDDFKHLYDVVRVINRGFRQQALATTSNIALHPTTAVLSPSGRG